MIQERIFDLFDRVMGSQWGCPRGPLGWLAGTLMVRGNAVMNDLGLDALEVQPGNDVLEIGFGPGTALERLAGLAGGGSLAGIDPSQLMVRRAAKRLSGQIAAGRADLRQGYSSHMPFPDASFDRVLSVNTIYFWEDPPSDFREIRRVMKAGGRCAVVFRATENETGTLDVHGMPQETRVDDVIDWMGEARFQSLDEQRRDAPFGPRAVTAVALVATATALS